MSRLGDTIRTNRIKQNMTLKALAKKTGVSSGFLEEVESGRRIMSDEQAQRILKVLGAQGPLSAELEVDTAPAPKPAPAAPRPYQIPAQEKPVHAEEAGDPKASWLDALSGIVKRIPVMDEKGEVIEHRLLPVIGGAIEGAPPEKVVYYRMPDDSMQGFRIHPGDILLTIPQKTPVDDALMLLKYKDRHIVRKIKKMDGSSIMLQRYGREFQADTLLLRDVVLMGQCIRLEAALP